MPSLRKNLTLVLIAALWASSVAPCYAVDHLGARQFELSRNLHDTVYRITIYQSEHKLSALRPLLERVFAEMKASLDRLDKDGSDGALALDAAELELVAEAVRFSQLSRGAYDPTAGALTRTWAAARLRSEPPTKEETSAAGALSGVSELEINESSKFVKPAKPGMLLDLKDLAEGFAMDRAADMLKKNGVRSAVIQTDSAVLCLGEPTSAKSWRLAIEHPRNIDDLAAVFELPRAYAAATVGDYQDFFMFKGKRYTTVADPRTGRQPKAMPASTTAIAPNAAFAKVLARTFFVLGAEDGFSLLESLKDEGVDVINLEEDRPDHFNLASSENVRSMVREINL